MSLLKRLWNDESGAVITSEVVLLGTVAVIGVTTGVKMVSTAVNEEMIEVSKALRSLDQSYSFEGSKSCKAKTAGSSYTQAPVAESLNKLCDEQEKAKPEWPKHPHPQWQHRFPQKPHFRHDDKNDDKKPRFHHRRDDDKRKRDDDKKGKHGDDDKKRHHRTSEESNEETTPATEQQIPVAAAEESAPAQPAEIQ